MANYAYRYIEEIWENMKQIAQRINPNEDWSGLTVGGLNYTLARTYAEMASMLLYNLDMRANENYLDSLQLRSSVRRLAQLHGYTATERSGATTTLYFVATDDVTIPRGSQVASSSGVIFTTLEDLTLAAAGSLTGYVNAIHSSYKQLTELASGEQYEVVSTGFKDTLINHLRVRVNDVDFTQVDNFSASTYSSKHYIIDFDNNDNVVIMFGDGTRGTRLNTGDNVVLDVHYGGGTAGNGIAISSITNLRSVFTNSSNIDSVSNTSATSGGAFAESVEDLKVQLQSRNKYLAGIIAKDKAADTIKNALSWVADAYIEKSFDKINGINVPVGTVVAFPKSNSIGDMSSAQSSELSTYMENNGEIGVKWQSTNAINAPIELELEIGIYNRSLQSQTELAIKNALNTDNNAPFAFDSLAFDTTHYMRNLIDVIENVDNVRYAKVLRLHKTPQVYLKDGTSGADEYWADDIELGVDAEDGYMEFVFKHSIFYADSRFYMPVIVDTLNSSSITSNSLNLLKESYSYDAYGDLVDASGPWVREDTGSGKLEFKQLDRVWLSNEWTGSYFNDKRLLYISWVSDDDVTYYAWYSIASNSIHTIETTEDAGSPISGTAVSNLNSDGYSQVNIHIVRDLRDGLFVTPDGNNYTISHNTKDTIYTDDSNPLAPVGIYSHILFSESQMDIRDGSWQSNSDILRIRTDDTMSVSDVGVVIHIYTTPKLSQKLKYKNPREVFTLDSDDVEIRFV